MRSEEVISDDHTQHRIAEEFKPLVRGSVTCFGTPRTMCKREEKRPGLGEPVTQAIDQRGDGVGAQDLSPALP
jgi:hypothetical protein